MGGMGTNKPQLLSLVQGRCQGLWLFWVQWGPPGFVEPGGALITICLALQPSVELLGADLADQQGGLPARLKARFTGGHRFGESGSPVVAIAPVVKGRDQHRL